MNGIPVTLSIEIADSDIYREYPVLFDGLVRDAEADIYMFAYNIHSRSSFDRIDHDHSRIVRLRGDSRCPMGIVGVNEAIDETFLEARTVPEIEGEMLAKILSTSYHEISPRDLRSIPKAFAGLVRNQQKLMLTNVVVCGSKRVIQYWTWSAADWRAVEYGKLQECANAFYDDEAHMDILKTGDVFMLLYDADSTTSLSNAERVRNCLPHHKRTGTHQLVLVGESKCEGDSLSVLRPEGLAAAKKWGCGFRMVPRSHEGKAYDDICLQLADAYCRSTFNTQCLT